LERKAPFSVWLAHDWKAPEHLHMCNLIPLKPFLGIASWSYFNCLEKAGYSTTYVILSCVACHVRRGLPVLLNEVS